MLLADGPGAPPPGVLDWIQAAAWLCGIGYVVLMFLDRLGLIPKKANDETPVNQTQFSNALVEVRREMDQQETSLLTEMRASHKALSDQFKVLNRGAQRRMTKFGEKIHEVELNLAGQPLQMRQMIDEAINPLKDQVTDVQKKVVAIFGRLFPDTKHELP